MSSRSGPGIWPSRPPGEESAARAITSASLTMPTMSPASSTTGSALTWALTRSLATSNTVASAETDITPSLITSRASMAASDRSGVELLQTGPVAQDDGAPGRGELDQAGAYH